MKCPSCGFENIAGSDECESCMADLCSMDGLEKEAKSKITRVLMKDPLSRLTIRDVVMVAPSTTVYDAIISMNKSNTGCALIADAKGKLAGILTERDILFKMPDNVEELKTLPISEIMTKPVETLRDDTSLAYALHQMSVKRFRHSPVARKDGSYGMISSRDILKYLAKFIT